MTLRESEFPRGSPDDTTGIAGDAGDPIGQDGEQLLVRAGTRAANSDWDIEDEAITDLSDHTVADPTEVGGTGDMSGAIKSEDERPFSVAIEWLADDNETVLYREEPDSAQQTDDVIIEALTVKSDHAKVLITDESSDGDVNRISGTLNFH